MISAYIIILLVVLGLCLGSFACATTWRLRAMQLEEDKKSGCKVDEKEYKELKKLTGTSLSRDRSRCLACGYKLEWYDLIPLFSWVFLRGKCRKCGHKIGIAEPLAELGLALFFVSSYIFWPNTLIGGIEIAKFVIWLIAGVILVMLFMYDMKWYLMPTRLNYALVGLGIISAGLSIFSSIDRSAMILNILISVIILSGIYYVIYYLSRKKWIGFGDVILGLGLALLLSDWQAAYIALFAANFIGCLAVIPGMIRGKLKKDSHIPFGPLLILGFWIGGLFGAKIIAALLYGMA